MCPRRSCWEYSPFRADYPKTKTVSLVNWIHLNGKKKLSWGQLSMTFREILNDNQFHSHWLSISFSLTFSFILNENRFDCHWLLNPLSLTFGLILIDFFCWLGLSWNSKRLEWGGEDGLLWPWSHLFVATRNLRAGHHVHAHSANDYAWLHLQLSNRAHYALKP